MVVVLPAPLTPTTMTTAGGLGDLGHGALDGLQDFEQMLADESFQLAGVANQLAVDALADAFENFGGGGDADIGGNQRVFELIEQFGVNLLLAGDQILDLADQASARLLDARLEAFEKVRLLAG